MEGDDRTPHPAFGFATFAAADSGSSVTEYPASTGIRSTGSPFSFFVTCGSTVTTGVVRAVSIACATLGLRPTFYTFIRVGKMMVRVPASASFSACSGLIHTLSTDSDPSCTARWSSGALAR